MNFAYSHHIDDVITSRHSMWVFLRKAVEPKLIKNILTVILRAASGTNTQSWKVYFQRSKT